MINGMQGTGMWAISGGSFTWTTTFNFPPSNIIADASLAKVAGSNGSAMAYVRNWMFFNPGSNTFQSISWATAPDRAPVLTAIQSCPSVTFGLTVNNMYGYANVKVFFV